MPEKWSNMGADIELIEPISGHYGDDDREQAELNNLPCIKPYRVRINGTDVGILKKNSVRVDVGSNDLDGDPVSVTLTLWARSVTIRAE